MNKFKNMKKYIFLSVILLLLILTISIYCRSLNNSKDSTRNNAEHTTSNVAFVGNDVYRYDSERDFPVLERENFKKRIPLYIVIKVKNIKTKEIMDIICLHSKWKNICINRLKLVENESQYHKFMDDEYIYKGGEKIFDVDDTVFLELKEFEAKKFYKDKAKNGNKINASSINSIKDIDL